VIRQKLFQIVLFTEKKKNAQEKNLLHGKWGTSPLENSDKKRGLDGKEKEPLPEEGKIPTKSLYGKVRRAPKFGIGTTGERGLDSDVSDLEKRKASSEVPNFRQN